MGLVSAIERPLYETMVVASDYLEVVVMRGWSVKRRHRSIRSGCVGAGRDHTDTSL